MELGGNHVTSQKGRIKILGVLVFNNALVGVRVGYEGTIYNVPHNPLLLHVYPTCFDNYPKIFLIQEGNRAATPEELYNRKFYHTFTEEDKNHIIVKNTIRLLEHWKTEGQVIS